MTVDVLNLSESTQPAGTDRMLVWPADATGAADARYRTVASIANTAAGWFQLADYDLGVEGFGSSEAFAVDQTANFQAVFDAASAYAEANGCGAMVVLNPGNYRFNGTVTLPDISISGAALTVWAYGCRVLHKPTTTDVAMFAYEAPIGFEEQSVATGQRTLRWFGGWFDGDRVAGQTAFDLPCLGRAVMADMHVQAFDVGIDGRFALNNTFRDIHFNQNATHDIHLREGDWPESTDANSAPNMNRIMHTRHYGTGTNQGLIKIEQGGGNYIDHCVFEGAGGTHNIYIDTTNTSAVLNTIDNAWFENTVTGADIYSRTLHVIDVGIQFALGGPIIDASGGGSVRVTKIAYLGGGGAKFKAEGTSQKWWFDYLPRIDIDAAGTWVDSVVPAIKWRGWGDQIGAYDMLGTAGNPWSVTGFVFPDREFDPTTVTLPELAQTVASIAKTLIDQRRFSGTIGA